MTLGVEGREECVCAMAVKSHKTSGAQGAVVVVQSQENALSSLQGGSDYSSHKLLRQEVFLATRLPILGVELGERGGCEVGGMQQAFAMAYLALPVAFVKTGENFVGMADILYAVGDTLSNPITFPVVERGNGGAKILVE